MRSLAEHIAAHARERPSAPAYLGTAAPLDWRDYEAGSRALAALLAGPCRVRPGDRVAVLLPDGPDVHVALVGCERAGAVAVGIGPRAGHREIEHLLRVTGATVWISRGDHQGRATAEAVARWRREGLAITRHVEVGGPEGGGDGALRAGTTVHVDGEPFVLDARAAEPEAGGRAPDDLFLVNSTSGTSGLPKCVAHDQARWQAFHRFAVRHGRLTGDDVFMSVVPAPFGFGIWTSHVTPTLLGVPTVVMDRFEAGAALDLVERHGVSVLAAVSTQFILMLEAMHARGRAPTSLRVLFTGGEAVPFDRAAAFEDATGARVLQFYGSNETGAVSGTHLDDPREKRLRTAGRCTSSFWGAEPCRSRSSPDGF